MPDELSHSVKQQHARWADDWQRVAGGWRRWESSLSGSSWPLTQRLLSGLAPNHGERVLDIGCGSGDPGLAFAQAVAPNGEVLSIDLADAMLDTARQRADLLGLTNIAFRCAAPETLNEADAGFDVAVARFSVIFFPDMSGGLGAVHRMLKNSGRFGLSVWAPMDRNAMFAVAGEVMRELLDSDPPPPDAPGPHRLSGDGELADALTQAGFVIDRIEDAPFYNFAPSVETYLEMMLDMSPVLGRQMEQLDADTRRTAVELITANIAKYRNNGVVRVPALARVAIAHKAV